VECARLLLQNDKSLVLLADDDGMTCLHYLAGNKMKRGLLLSMVTLLMGADASLIDQVDYSGATALIKASFYTNRPNGPFLVAMLLQFGADPTLEYSHGWSS
jgi:ankyrin repeat protein